MIGMPFPRSLWPLALATLCLHGIAAEPPPYPRALVPGVTVQLVAQEPDVCTPTAIAADGKGRIWVLQNNTHFRPKDYQGPPTDRILILQDLGPNGRARKITTYAEGFSDGMGLLLLPGGDVLVSTRAEVLRFHDEKGDGREIERAPILTLKTEETYPHNGLSGLALGPDGKVYLGLGENRGKRWQLTGSDGSTARGVDEGGVFRFDPDGNHLQYWAEGLWNPFGLTFDPSGRLFAVDNDPGAGENCRLLQILPGGDYGYRFRYKSELSHPFVSWQGRWPGTLPPLCLIAEGPTGPRWVGDALLTCSWSDFGIQRHRLEPTGAGFRSVPEWIVQGDHRFRPTGIAELPDGSLVVSDWVDSSYPVHGKGRIWRLAGYPHQQVVAPVPNEPEKQMKALLSVNASYEEALAMLDSSDPYLRHGAVQALAPFLERLLADPSTMATPGKRLGAVLVARRSRSAHRADHLEAWLQDDNFMIRREALQWVAEEGPPMFADKLDLALKGKVPPFIVDAYVAALDAFSTAEESADPKARTAARDGRIFKLLLDDHRDTSVRAEALRLLPPSHRELTVSRLRTWITESAEPLQTQALHVLMTRNDQAAQAALSALAQDMRLTSSQRADAVAGLVHSAAVSEETRHLLEDLGKSSDRTVAQEAVRTLGPLASEALKNAAAPASAGMPEAKILQMKGDAEAGRRLFFHPNGPGCSHCHQVAKQGQAIGPDLTHLETFTPAQLLTAIREPSKDIAPAFLYWHVKMQDGSEGYGVDIARNDTARFFLIDAAGKVTPYRHDQVSERTALPVSMMPPGLVDRFSGQEVADLIAFLRQARE